MFVAEGNATLFSSLVRHFQYVAGACLFYVGTGTHTCIVHSHQRTRTHMLLLGALLLSRHILKLMKPPHVSYY